MKIKISIFIGLLIVFLTSNTSFAFNEINKNLSLTKGYSYLLSFDEKILRYRLGDEKAVNVEPLSDIFNEKRELIIKPIKNLNTNLLVWTNSSVYNFNLIMNQTAETMPSSPIQTFNKKYINLDNEIKAELDELEFDKPPYLPDAQPKMMDLELDKPPGIQ